MIRLGYFSRAASAWVSDITGAVRCGGRPPVNMSEADHQHATGDRSSPREKGAAKEDKGREADEEMEKHEEPAEVSANDKKENDQKHNIQHDEQKYSKKPRSLKPKASSPLWQRWRRVRGRRNLRAASSNAQRPGAPAMCEYIDEHMDENKKSCDNIVD